MFRNRLAVIQLWTALRGQPQVMDAKEARELAWALLHQDRDRWQHVQAAAARAEELRSAVPPEQQELLVAAGWLHDIGYSRVLRDSGFHPLDGARYLEAGGHRREAALVAHHSGARFVAVLRGLGPELDRYPFAEDPLTDALTYADQNRRPTRRAHDRRRQIGGHDTTARCRRPQHPRPPTYGSRTSSPPPRERSSVFFAREDSRVKQCGQRAPLSTRSSAAIRSAQARTAGQSR